MALFSDKDHWLVTIKVMTRAGEFGGNAFVHCEKKGLCGPSVLPGPNEGGHLYLNRGEFIPGCAGLLFIKDKEAGPQCSLFGQSRTRLLLCRSDLSEPIGKTY